MIFDNINYIKSEAFPEENQELIAVLGPILNGFMQEVYDLANKRIDFDNKVENLISFSITVDANGKILGNNRINVGKVADKGTSVTRAVNITNPSIFPTSQPFINYENTEITNVIKITNISGIKSGTYNITAIVY